MSQPTFCDLTLIHSADITEHPLRTGHLPCAQGAYGLAENQTGTRPLGLCWDERYGGANPLPAEYAELLS